MSKKDRKLHLVLKKHWYKMIEEGTKKEEYRDLSTYWRLLLTDDGELVEFDRVIFYQGYNKGRKSMEFECRGIKIDYPHPPWIDKGYNDMYYCIKLGRRLDG